MKKIIDTFYEGLITWAEVIAEYRNSKSSKYYY